MSDAVLAREAAVFTRYLTGRSPTPYVSERYADAHRALGGLVAVNGHDRWVLRVARSGSMGCRVADGWARHAAPAGPLRSKLVVMLAILEVTPPFAEVLDRPAHGPALEWALMVGAGLASVLALLAGAAVFLPMRLLAGRKAP